VLDAFERAFPDQSQPQTAQEANDPSMVAGLEMVRKQLSTILSRHGLEAIDAKGKTFDPNLHQAIQRIDSEEVDAETVKDEFAKGYKLNGRLLRPTMVSVVVPGASKDSEN
jgi:molecular chaperone GrpE